MLSDELKPDRNFHVSQLFRADLRLITPILWLGYFASSLAIYFAVSWGPIVVEDLKFARQTSALVASLGSLLGAVAGLLLMRFTDRRGPGAVAVYPAICVPVLLAMGFGLIPREAFLAEMERLAERMRGRPPSLAHASPMQLFAYYCVGEGAREAPA